MEILGRIFRKIKYILCGNTNVNIRKPLPVFANTQKDTIIEEPYKITNPERIYIGDNVGLGSGSILFASTVYPRGWMCHPQGDHIEQTFESKLVIGNRVTASSALQVNAFKEIVIEDDVMMASNVFICDGLHGYERADKPYRYQGISNIAPIYIRKAAWIGQNVVILPGVEIGEYSIIGANSVVTRSIPPRSIAVGSPARVIKQWDEETESWKPVA